MSELDDFARNLIGPTLRPGEVMLSIGWMAKGLDWRNQQERYFAVGTNQRLVVIQTGRSLMSGGPKIGNDGVVSYELAQLANAASRTIGALTFNLAFDTPSGRVGYAVPSPTIVGAKSVDGHVDFVNVYLHWLCRHVAAGTLRSPEGQAAAAAEWQHRGNLTAANDRYRVQIGDTRTSALGWVRWPLALGILLFALLPIGFAYKAESVKQIGYIEREIDFIRANAATAEYDVDAAIAQKRARIDREQRKQGKGTLMQVGGVVGLLAGIGFTIVLTSRKRAAARAAAA